MAGDILSIPLESTGQEVKATPILRHKWQTKRKESGFYSPLLIIISYPFSLFTALFILFLLSSFARDPIVLS